MKRVILLSVLFSLISIIVIAQSVGINNDGTLPDNSAMLDVKNPNKGFLAPRVALTATNVSSPVTSPALSLLVFNTATAGSGATAVTPGFYYWNGTSWMGTFNTGSATSSFTYSIGQDIQGGKIFWLDTTHQHGLVVSSVDQSSGAKWCNENYINTQAIRSGIYGGDYNTNLINRYQGNGSYAALLAAQYSGGSFGDWYLPSKEELNLMYQMRAVIGSLTGSYWSSTEVLINAGGICDVAWTQDLTGGNQSSTLKNISNKVRAIRRF